MRGCLRIIVVAAVGLLAGAPGFADDFRIDESGEVIRIAAPEPGTPAAQIADIRRLLAEGKGAAAEHRATKFIDEYKETDQPLLAEAVLLRGDAKVARMHYYQALYDYEFLCREFSASEHFVTAQQRELDIAVKFVDGMNRRWLGLRLFSAEDEGVELLVRIQERLPGSRLAERAGIILADYFYRKRMMSLAVEAYELFLRNYPDSAWQQKAMRRKILAHIAMFKGPAYDSSGLENARLGILDFQTAYPQAAQESGIDDSLLGWVDSSAARKLLETARWYLKQDDVVSGRYVLGRLIRKYPKTAPARDALNIMVRRGWIDAEPTPTDDEAAPGALPSEADVPVDADA
ncbi:MAG: outer membrane protein assembly factor BamD [Phycisphaerales bacterium]|nr:outer membrane protein assembly factor BamD [Phycisphaerales bacterium]